MKTIYKQPACKPLNLFTEAPLLDTSMEVSKGSSDGSNKYPFRSRRKSIWDSSTNGVDEDE